MTPCGVSEKIVKNYQNMSGNKFFNLVTINRVSVLHIFKTNCFLFMTSVNILSTHNMRNLDGVQHTTNHILLRVHAKSLKT